MTESLVNCFNLIKRTIDLSRDLAIQKVNRTIEDIHFQTCKRLLKYVEEELEIHGAWLSKLTHINAPQTCIAKLVHSHCNSLVTNLKLTMGQIEAFKQHPYTAAFPTSLKELMVEFKNHFVELSAKLEKLVASIKELYYIQDKDDADTSSNVDNFVFINMVQPNPLHVFLDYQTKDTPECQLKKAVFQEGPNIAVSVVANGMGGVGKTCALRGVGLLEEAKLRFPGGIFFMSLGADAGKYELIRNLAEFVKYSGGTRASVEIRDEDSIAKAVTLTAKWFGDHVCLFLVDDVWCRRGIESTIPEVLAGLAQNSRSRVAFTTRDRTVRSDLKIQFRKRGDTDAKKMLLLSSGCVNVSDSASEKLSIKYLLNISDGLPIALGVIGRKARHLIEERSVDENEVWSLVRDDFMHPDDLLLEDASRDSKNEKVSNILWRSLEMVDNLESDENLTDQFACFSILQKRQEVPVDVLDRMWGVGPRKARTQIEKLERFSIVEILHRFQGEMRMCFVVHDLFMDISRNLANEKDGFRAEVCTRVLNSYVSNKTSTHCNKNLPSKKYESFNKRKSGGLRYRIRQILKGKKEEKTSSFDKHVDSSSKPIGGMETIMFQESWVAVIDDGFAQRNAFRLLEIAGMYDEGIALVLDPRWVTQQVNCFGRKQFLEDAAIILKHFQQIERRESYASCTKAIRMVKAAVAESEPHVINATGTSALWSQLYGRLIALRHFKFIDSFVNGIDEFAPSPWVRSQGALPSPKVSAGKVMSIPSVRFLRSTSDCVDIVSYNDGQRCFHLRQYFSQEDNVHLKKTWSVPHEQIANTNDLALNADASTLAVCLGNDIMVINDDNSRDGTCGSKVKTLRQHKEEVWSVSLSADGRSLIRGGSGGEIVIWRLADGLWEATRLEGHTENVRSVRMCPDGNKAVSGAQDRTLRVWGQLDGGGWRSDLMDGQSSWIRCVDMSCEGRCVVSGSDDCNVRVWEKSGTQWVLSMLEGHSGWINDLAVDKEGMRIVSASNDCTARLWECLEGSWSCTATLKGHSDLVSCVAIGSNHSEIFSSGLDGTVRMWNDTRDLWESEGLRRHTGQVRDVTISGDRRGVVSGSEEGEVVLWEKDGPAWKVNILKKHSGLVNAVSISSNGRLVVSGSRDGMVCVSEEEKGKWTSHELFGHTKWVRAVTVSPHGEVVATASCDKTAKIWKRIDRSWVLNDTLEGHEDCVNSVALSEDGSRVVSCSHDRTVRVWDGCHGSRTAVETLWGHEENVSAVAITPDGSTISSGDYSGAVKLWAQSGDGKWASTTIGNLEGVVRKVTFSADGSFIRAEDVGGNLIWSTQRDGAWVEDSTHGDASAAEGVTFGDGQLDRLDWPVDVVEMLVQTRRLWSLTDGWYFAQIDTAPFAAVLQIVASTKPRFPLQRAQTAFSTPNLY